MGEKLRKVCKVRVIRPTTDFRKIDENGAVHCSYKCALAGCSSAVYTHLTINRLGDWILVTGFVELSHQVGQTQRMIASHNLPVCISEEWAKHHIHFANRFESTASGFMVNVCRPCSPVMLVLTYSQFRTQALKMVFNTLFADSPTFLHHLMSSEPPIINASVVSAVSRILIDCLKKTWRSCPYYTFSITYWCRETAPMLFERGLLYPSLIRCVPFSTMQPFLIILFSPLAMPLVYC